MPQGSLLKKCPKTEKPWELHVFREAHGKNKGTSWELHRKTTWVSCVSYVHQWNGTSPSQVELLDGSERLSHHLMSKALQADVGPSRLADICKKKDKFLCPPYEFHRDFLVNFDHL